MSHTPEPETVYVYIEEMIAGAWTRHKRLGLPMHPAFAKSEIAGLKRIHRGAEYRTVEEVFPDDAHSLPIDLLLPF